MIDSPSETAEPPTLDFELRTLTSHRMTYSVSASLVIGVRAQADTLRPWPQQRGGGDVELDQQQERALRDLVAAWDAVSRAPRDAQLRRHALEQTATFVKIARTALRDDDGAP